MGRRVGGWIEIEIAIEIEIEIAIEIGIEIYSVDFGVLYLCSTGNT